MLLSSNKLTLHSNIIIKSMKLLQTIFNSFCKYILLIHVWCFNFLIDKVNIYRKVNVFLNSNFRKRNFRLHFCIYILCFTKPQSFVIHMVVRSKMAFLSVNIVSFYLACNSIHYLQQDTF